MKNKVLMSFLIIAMCILLAGCDSDFMYDFYVIQLNTEYEANDCISCLSNLNADEPFCLDIGRITINEKEVSLLEAINDNLLTKDELDCLEQHNVVKDYRIPMFLYKIGEALWPIIRSLFYCL